MFEMFALKSFKWISNIINFTKEITFMYRAWYKHSVKSIQLNTRTKRTIVTTRRIMEVQA